jgi:hypothetical protein
MKLQLETYTTKYTIETPNDDLDAIEYLDIFVGLLHQAGFHNNTIKEAIEGLAEK